MAQQQLGAFRHLSGSSSITEYRYQLVLQMKGIKQTNEFMYHQNWCTEVKENRLLTSDTYDKGRGRQPAQKINQHIN